MSIEHDNLYVKQLGTEIAAELADLARFFKPGVRLTFMARQPGYPDRDMIITDDGLDDLAEMIARRKAGSSPGNQQPTTDGVP